MSVQVVYLDEGDMCVINRNAATGEVTFVCEPLQLGADSVATPKDFTVHHLELTLDAIEKGGFKHCKSPPAVCFPATHTPSLAYTHVQRSIGCTLTSVMR